MVEDGEDKPVDQVRFAIGTHEQGLLSTEWLATRAHGRSRDIFVSTRGLAKDVKITFHENDVVLSFLAERAPTLREKGMLKEGESRQRSSVPVRQETWIAAHIDFIAGALRTPDRPLPLRRGKEVSLLPPPPRGYLRRVAVAHSFGGPPVVEAGGELMSPFARVEKDGRHIAFFTALVVIDEAAEEQKLRALVEQIPADEEAARVADKGDLAAVLWGDEDGHLNLIEIHNILRAPRPSGGIDPAG